MAARSVGTLTVGDYSREKSTIGFSLATPGDNDYTAAIAALTAIQGGVEAVSRGNVRQRQISRIDPITASWPSDEEAQREDKWLVSYRDTLEYLDAPTNTIPNPGFGRVFNWEIPCADRDSVVMTPGTDVVDFTQAPMSTLVTALASYARSPYGGSVQVQAVTFVGRNT
jgi:hypothetical protein